MAILRRLLGLLTLLEDLVDHRCHVKRRKGNEDAPEVISWSLAISGPVVGHVVFEAGPTHGIGPVQVNGELWQLGHCVEDHIHLVQQFLLAGDHLKQEVQVRVVEWRHELVL